METMQILPIIALIYSGILLLMLTLPAHKVDGYLVDQHTGQPEVYRINGLIVMLACLVITCYLVYRQLIPITWLYTHRWDAVVSACILGIAYSAWLVLPAQASNKGFAADFFLGRILNKSYFGRVDVKMFLYLVGAIMLFLNLVSFSAFHVQTFADQANPGVYLHAALLTFFIFDYLIFERVHLYTYDIFAERLGFKLAWGCFVFYPFFYVIGIWSTAHLPTPGIIDTLGWIWLTLCSVIFLCGWALARGANMQKYYYKRQPTQPFLGIAPQTVGQGAHSLLSNGWWGVSRHVNYLGEILMAIGIAASLGHFDTPWPWLYPLYYIILLGTRERDDEKRCAAKYGVLWSAYKKAVPYRIIPKIY